MLHLLFVLSLLVSTALCKVQCLDASGSPVDWWLMFKLGKTVSPYAGYTTAYADANTPGSWTMGNINDTSALQYTVKQLGLYGASVNTDSVAWAMWNDQTHKDLEGPCVDHEKDGQGNIYGHTKGMIGFDSSTGFWLAHSAPGFPYSHDLSPNYWHFPYSQTIYAQHFFCISVPTAKVDQFGAYLQYYHAYVYDTNIPTSMNLPSFSAFASMHFHKAEYSMTFSSLGGQAFSAVGKYATTNADLYEDYVAPLLQTNLYVQSWCGGTFGKQCQPSYCKGASIENPSDPQQGQSTYAFDSVDVESVSFNGASYTNYYNHAKWAIALQSSSVKRGASARPGSRVSAPAPWFCAADNNRQYTQRLRGGGALCMQHSALYAAMKAVVSQVNTTCPE